VLGHGSPVLALTPLFNGIASRPGDPAYWWIYALLLSTLIPSVANLLIGSVSLTRGIPGISRLVLRQMRPDVTVPIFDRPWMAAVLTAQWAIGAALMLASFALLSWLASILIPETSTWFLDYTRWFAGLNLPGQAWALVSSVMP
jgi:hypothetical protein